MYRQVFFVIAISTLASTSVFADGGFCRKCEVLKKYHSENPSKYEYYDDYMKDLEEKGADAVNPSIEDLPEDVRFIMNPESNK